MPRIVVVAGRTPEEWVYEKEASNRPRFTTMKVKARPWFYPAEQLEAISNLYEII